MLHHMSFVNFISADVSTSDMNKIDRSDIKKYQHDKKKSAQVI